MTTKYSSTWKSSTDTAKQRKYVYNAPRHIKSKFLSCNLSKALKKEHGTRSLRVRINDTVKVMRGDHKGKTGEIVKIDLDNTKIYVKDIKRRKVNGQEVNIPLKPSNLQIIDLELKDEKRLSTIKKKKEAPKTKTKPATKNTDAPKKEAKPKKTEKKDKN